MKNILFKNKNSRTNGGLLFFALLFAALATSTCSQHIALGGGVDILPPSGKILYPDAGETPIRGSFVLKGTAKDDEGVKAVSIVFENIETKEQRGPFAAVVSNPGAYNVSWTAHIDNESTETVPGHELVKLYPIPDGEYAAIVTVTDSNNKTSQFTKNYKIDNTPPVFIVSRPSTIIVNDESAAQADPYGSIFTVVGQAEDKNKIEDLTLKVDGTNISISKKFVGKNVNEEIATATKNGPDFIDPLYQYNANNGSPKIKAHVFLTDNARSFRGSGEEGQGNTSEWYYVRDKDIRSVLEKGYTADIINDYFAGKKGSASSSNKTDRLLTKLYNDTDPEGQAVKQILQNARIMTNDGIIGPDQKFSVFTLDPNKSPGFKVSNSDSLPLSLPRSKPDLTPGIQFFNGTVPPTVFIDLIRNKTGDELVESSDYNAYRQSKIVINMYECNEVSYVVSGDKKTLNLVQSVTPAYSLKFEDLTAQDENDHVVEPAIGGKLTVKWKLPNTFSQGHYVIQVEGKDTKDNDFVAYDNNNSPGGVFVIHFKLTDNNLIVVPRAPSRYIKDDFDVIANVSSSGLIQQVHYKLNAPAGSGDNPLVHTSGTEWKTAALVPIASAGADGQRSVHFWAKDNAGQTATASLEFIKDTKAPVPVLNYPPADAEQAGVVTIMGTVTDEYAGVNKDGTKYIIGKQTAVPTVDSAGWQDMNKTTAASWQFTYNLDDFSAAPATHGDPVPGKPSVYDIPVYILTEDAIGNKTVTEKKVRFDSDGDKPIVTILSPQQNQTLGGMIQVFGTAATRINGPADVGEVYIQFSKNGNFADTADGTFGTTVTVPPNQYDADWYKGGSGQLVPGTDGTSGGANWEISVNKNGEFNNPNGENWEVYFRLRAKNKNNNKYGPWSNPVKISIDKAYPTIGSPIPLKVGSTPTDPHAINYTPGMWIPDGKKLMGSLFDESGIKSVTISSPELLGSQTYNLSQALSNHWIAEDTANAPSSPGAKNYTLQIPLNLSALGAAAKRKGEITVKIKIAENTPKELSWEETLKFNFDITPPSGDLGEFIHRYSGSFRVSSVSNKELAQKVKEHAPDPSPDYSKLHLLINDKIVKVTSVSGNTVHFSPGLDRAGTYNCLLYKKPYVIRNNGGNWLVRGVANDDGSGIKKIEAEVSVAGQSAKSITIAPIEGIKITKQLGGQVSWEGEIDLSTLKDGKGTLSCKIYDEQDNVHEVQPLEVVVKNKPIAVRKITLKTDIGGKPKSAVSDNMDKESNKDSNLDFTANFTSSGFAFKNKDNSKIRVEFTGGQGQVKYQLKKGNGTKLGGLTDIATGGEIDLKNHLSAIGNSNGTPTKIILELWDEAHDFTQGTDSAFAKISIMTLFEAIDNKVPAVVVLPFYWNGDGKDINDNFLNSLYAGSRANGHVEIEKIAELHNGYSSVSGRVSISGFAYDNVKIDNIKAVLPNTSSLTVTATRSGDTWTSDKKMFNTDGVTPKDGAELTVETLGADYLGFYVKWRLDWDSEKAPVGLGKEIKVTVNDGTNNSDDSDGHMPSTGISVSRATATTAEHTVFGGKKPGQFVAFKKDETQYLTRIREVDGNKVTLEDSVPREANEAYMYDYKANRAKVRVNIVPFITEVETLLKNADGNFKGAFSRASTGEYPVRMGETIKVKGFNLAGGTVKLETESLGTNFNALSIGALHTSGELSVEVGTEKSINNMVKITKPYNIEANNANNNILNVNRKLFVWKMIPLINNAALESPQFVMDKDSKYYLTYGNLKSFGTNGDAMRLSTKINGAENNDWEKCYSKYHNTVIAYDENGKPYLGATNTDRATNSTAFTLFFQEAQVGAYAYSTNGQKRRLENSNNAIRGVYDVNRVQIPKMAVRGRGTSSDPARLALVYFDKNVANDAPVKFRYGTVKSSTNVTGGLSYNIEPDGSDAEPNNSGSAKGYEVVANNTSAKKGGPYAAVGLTSTNRAIVVWYDAAHSQLIYSYRDMGTGTYTEPTSTDRFTSTWQDHAVVIDSGAPLYVDLVIDEQDGVHIGYYSGSRSGVRYAYLAPSKVKGAVKPNSGDFKIATVDTYMNPGSYLKMGVRKENGKQVPYISYYHNGFLGSSNAARIAWLKDGIGSDGVVKDGIVDGKFTGNWVALTVPATEGIQQYTICQGTPTGGTYENKVIAAYFTNANYEMAVLQK